VAALTEGSQAEDLTRWRAGAGGSGPCSVRGVPEPLELFRLKCADHCYTGDMTSTHVKRNNPMVCRVTSR
jgi:hypothetical protein